MKRSCLNTGNSILCGCNNPKQSPRSTDKIQPTLTLSKPQFHVLSKTYSKSIFPRSMQRIVRDDLRILTACRRDVPDCVSSRGFATPRAIQAQLSAVAMKQSPRTPLPSLFSLIVITVGLFSLFAAGASPVVAEDISCTTCGARARFAANAMVTACSYCGSSVFRVAVARAARKAAGEAEERAALSLYDS